MRSIKIKTYAAILFFLSFSLTAACAVNYKPDLLNQRRNAVKDDKEILIKKNRITFASPLTLKDAINISIKNNLDLWVNRILTDAENEKAFSEKLKMLPVFNTEMDIVRRSDYDMSYHRRVNTDTMQPEGNIVKNNSTISDEKEIMSGNLKLSWNALDFGLTYIRSRQKAIHVLIKEIEEKRQTQRLAAKVVSAFWKAVIANKNLERISELDKMLKEYKRVVKDAVDKKRASLIALKEAENKIIELSMKTSQIQSQFEAAKVELGELMGLDPSIKFEIADERVDNFLLSLPDPKKLDIKKMEDTALMNRPELFISDLELNINREEAKALLLRMLPGLRFDAVHMYNSNEYLYYGSWYTVGANLAWDIFGLPSKYYAHKAQEKNIVTARTKRIEMTAAIMTQLRLALHNFAIERDRFQSYESFLKNHEDIVRIGAEYHKFGLLSDADMVRRTIEKFAAKLGRDEVLAHTIDAFATLMITMGLNYEEWFEDYKISLITVPNEKIEKTGEPARENLITAYIYFDSYGSHLDKKYYSVLDAVVANLKKHPSFMLEIPSEPVIMTKEGKILAIQAYNEKLLKERINVIREYITDKGVDIKRVISTYDGYQEPIVFNKQYMNRKLR